ncbi:MAG: hypothetical protein ABSB74_06760 [Tepidisphaeraceae bacterium]
MESNDPSDPLRREIHKLAFNGATNRDISEVLKINEVVLEERFGAVLVAARAGRRVLIRGKQTEVAVKGGNAAMLSLLGKNELGQGRATTAGKTPRPEPELEPKVG